VPEIVPQPETAESTPRLSSGLGRAILAPLLLIAAVLGARDITSEAALSMHGDMPRYMMDGVFLWDLIKSGGAWSVDALVRFSEEYFARYPALSLGHHPPLVFVVLVPFYAIFGVSVLAARLSMLACFLIATVWMFSYARRHYGTQAAAWGVLLFITNPFLVGYWQRVLSEMPLITLVLGSLVALDRFCDTGRRKYYVWFMAAFVASLYAKQLAVFMLPVYLLIMVSRVKMRRLLSVDVISLTMLGALLVVPLIAMTYMLSPFNVSVAIFSSRRTVSRLDILISTFRTHLSPPMIAAVLAGIVVASVKRDRRVLVNLVWIAAVVGGVVFVTGRVDPTRFAIFAMPAYCLCAAGLVANLKSTMGHRVAVGALSAVMVWQVWAGRDVRPVGAGGYEEAARFVIAESQSPVVLFSGSVDTGYFVFFVRKNDPDGRLIVLRSDKLLTTSYMGRMSIEDRITQPEEVYPLLDKFGVRYIVIEDRHATSVVQEMFRSELKTGRFVERRRFPTASRDRRLRDVDVVIYEYLDARPPDPNAELDIRLPVIGRGINVRLGNLMEGAQR
jgi:hypothetical protein